MNEQDKNGDELSMDEARKRLALALLAMYDIEGAEALARQDNVPFDRELALKQIEAMLGKEEADATRFRWSPEAEEESYQRSRKGIEIGMRLAAMDRMLAKFTKIWKWSAEQLAEMLSPMGGGAWAATPALAGRSANLADNAGEAPLVTPVIDSENEKLFITLHFAQGVPTIPRSKDSIHLYIDGTPIENFSVAVIEGQGETSLDLEGPLDVTYAERHSRMGCEVHCNPHDLNEMAVVLTTGVEESGNVSEQAEPHPLNVTPLRHEARTPYRIITSHEPRRLAASTEVESVDDAAPVPQYELEVGEHTYVFLEDEDCVMYLRGHLDEEVTHITFGPEAFALDPVGGHAELYVIRGLGLGDLDEYLDRMTEESAGWAIRFIRMTS
jgi:hypothetical protein